MGIAIEQKVVLSAPPDRVWAFLTDPVQVAACIPGAAITSRIDDRTYEGTMTVKVGPVTATYKGRASIERLDPEHLEAEIVGRGQDVKGKGGAELRMKSRLDRGRRCLRREHQRHPRPNGTRDDRKRLHADLPAVHRRDETPVGDLCGLR
jgi:uncharacterized protein YndB with AHSA1/START domain